MGIAQQFGIESTASDFIDRKLLEEQRYELKLIIDKNLRIELGVLIIKEKLVQKARLL